MAVPTFEEIQRDDRVMAVARVLAVANETAIGKGMDVARALITITEESPPDEHVWQVHYGPRDYQRRRGGDLIVFVDDRSAAVTKVVRGQ